MFVNVLDDDGRMVHSDGIAASQLITVTSLNRSLLYPQRPAAPVAIGDMDTSTASPVAHAADGALVLRNGSPSPGSSGLGSTPAQPAVQQPLVHRRQSLRR